MFRTTLRPSLALAVVLAASTTVWLEAAAHAVSQKGKVFAPGTINVKVGDSVTFKNDDDVTHNAFSTSKGNEFNAKAQTPGSSADVVFKTKGKATVKCAFHPGMSLTVTVE
jgi:plastocyanin